MATPEQQKTIQRLQDFGYSEEQARSRVLQETDDEIIGAKNIKEYKRRYGKKAESEVINTLMEQGYSREEAQNRAQEAKQAQETPGGSGFFGNISNLLTETKKRFADVPSDVVETAKGVFGAIKESGQEGGEELREVREGEQSPIQGGTRIAGDVGAGVGNAFGELMIGIGKLGLTPEEEQAVKDTAVRVVQSEPVQSAIELGERVIDEVPLSDDAKENIMSVVQAGSTPFQAIGAGATARTTGRVLDTAEDIAARGGQAARERIKDVQVFDNLPRFDKESTKEVARKVFKVDDPVNVTPDEQALGANEGTKVALRGEGEFLRAITNEVADSWTNPNADPFGLARDRVNNVMGKVQEQLSDIGGDIGRVRQKFATTKVDNATVEGIKNSFENKLSNIGYQVVRTDDGVSIERLPGRQVRISPADQRRLVEVYEDIIGAQSGTKQTLLDNRVNIDSIVDFDRLATDPVDKKVENLLKGLRNDYKQALNKGLTPEEQALNDKYSEILKVIEGYDKSSSRGKNIEYFLERVFGTRGSEARGVMQDIQELTGVNLIGTATALQLAKHGLPGNRQSRLSQAISDAGADLIADAAPGGLLKDLYNSLGKISDTIRRRLGAQPEKEQAMEVLDVIRNMDIDN